MKKLYNKSLMYQFFYIGKWALMVGIILYGIWTYGLINSNLTNLSQKISSLDGNTLDRLDESYIIFLYLIIFSIYVVVTGLNKRNNKTFLISGPYSKEEIKRNEIIFLLISLFLLVFTFLYINICLYVRGNNLLTIASGQYTELLIRTIKLVIVGIAFIAYLTFMDMLFSNIIITILAMIGAPIILAANYLMISEIANTLNSFRLYSFNLVADILYLIKSMISYIIGEDSSYYEADYRTTICILIITVVTFMIIWKINKEVTINKVNNLFVFPIVAKVVYFIIPFTISLVIIVTVISFNNSYRSNFSGSFNGTMLFITLIGFCLAISYFFKNLLSKLFKELIKK